jgi:hypothetical protein
MLLDDQSLLSVPYALPATSMMLLSIIGKPLAGLIVVVDWLSVPPNRKFQILIV